MKKPVDVQCGETKISSCFSWANIFPVFSVTCTGGTRQFSSSCPVNCKSIYSYGLKANVFWVFFFLILFWGKSVYCRYTPPSDGQLINLINSTLATNLLIGGRWFAILSYEYNESKKVMLFLTKGSLYCLLDLSFFYFLEMTKKEAIKEEA